MDKLVDVISLSGSAFATAITVLFWMVKSRRERPSLKTYAVGEMEAGQGPARKEGHVHCFYGFRGVVANYSTLPNAVIGVRAWLKKKDGEWVPAEVKSGNGNDPLPLNIPSMQTSPLNLDLSIVAPGEISGSTTADRSRNALAQLSSPPEVKFELIALGKRTFRDIVAAEKAKAE